MNLKIPFNRPYMSSHAFQHVEEAIKNGHLSGDGPFTKKCQSWMEEQVKCPKSLLTHSGTAALEMTAILSGVGPGDEVIMPSFTFVSTANAFALRGATPVFVDIRPDTLNIDEKKIQAAINSRTKAIVVVHYGGVGCQMEAILEIAKKHKLLVIEDAAHAILSTYQKKQLGSFGQLSIFSFHETKVLHCGEGGALLINDPAYAERAEIIREKGTDRSRFFRGEVDKYTWRDMGSSYLPSDLNAAFLWSQFEEAEEILRKRLILWNQYYDFFKPFEEKGIVRRPILPGNTDHNGHLFYLLLRNQSSRDAFITQLKKRNIMSVFHFLPLHESPMGQKIGKIAAGGAKVTEDLSRRLVRLPLWIGMEPFMAEILENLLEVLSE